MAKWTGTVRMYVFDKGYGQIVPDGGGKLVFVHWSAIMPPARELTRGDRVEFDVLVDTIPGDGAALRAQNVRLIGK